MGDTSGSIIKVILDGTTFEVVGDANVSEMIGGFENDRIVYGSGKSSKKMTRRVQKRDGLVVKANPDEKQRLKELNDRTDDFDLAYTTADGTTSRAKGSIFADTRETMENRATVELHPNGDWEDF